MADNLMDKIMFSDSNKIGDTYMSVLTLKRAMNDYDSAAAKITFNGCPELIAKASGDIQAYNSSYDRIFAQDVLVNNVNCLAYHVKSIADEVYKMEHSQNTYNMDEAGRQIDLTLTDEEGHKYSSYSDYLEGANTIIIGADGYGGDFDITPYESTIVVKGTYGGNYVKYTNTVKDAHMSGGIEVTGPSSYGAWHGSAGTKASADGEHSGDEYWKSVYLFHAKGYGDFCYFSQEETYEVYDSNFNPISKDTTNQYVGQLHGEIDFSVSTEFGIQLAGRASGTLYEFQHSSFSKNRDVDISMDIKAVEVKGEVKAGINIAKIRETVDNVRKNPKYLKELRKGDGLTSLVTFQATAQFNLISASFTEYFDDHLSATEDISLGYRLTTNKGKKSGWFVDGDFELDWNSGTIWEKETSPYNSSHGGGRGFESDNNGKYTSGGGR